MSTPRYQGRHGVAPDSVAARMPSPLRRRLLLSIAAAGVVIVTATGATVADSAPLTAAQAAPAMLDLSRQHAVVVRTEQASDEAASDDIALRRQAAGIQTAALRGRVEEQQRAARTAKRKAAQAAAARARATAARARAVAARARAVAAERARVAAARATAQQEARRWVRAIRTGQLTSGFGPRWGKTHDGLDIAAPTGTPVYAMSRGTVILSDYVSSFGNKVEIRYWNGTVSWYGHLSRLDVRTGQTVTPGEQVGLVGNTGYSFGPHLHLEIHPHGGDDPIDPYPWLARRGLIR